MNILHQLTEKPWEPVRGSVALRDGAAFDMPASTLGVRIYLAVVTVLFSILVVAYAERMAYEDWRPAPRQWLLWLNTASLIASSAAFQWALVSLRRGHFEAARTGLLAAGALATAFLLGQAWAWQQLNAMDFFDVTNPAIAFFYLITVLHGLHMVGGLVAWGRTLARVRQVRAGGPEAWPRAASHLKLCATYWHFLLIVWLVLFGLLFSGNDNLDILLSICGLR